METIFIKETVKFGNSKKQFLQVLERDPNTKLIFKTSSDTWNVRKFIKRKNKTGQVLLGGGSLNFREGRGHLTSSVHPGVRPLDNYKVRQLGQEQCNLKWKCYVTIHLFSNDRRCLFARTRQLFSEVEVLWWCWWTIYSRSNINFYATIEIPIS